MKKLIIGFLALLGFLAIAGAFVLIGIAVISTAAKPGVPRHVILEIDFEGGVIEAIPDDPFAEYMMENRLTVRDVVDALDKAAEDRRVEALFARIGGGGISLPHVQEIRDAVARFRASGKPAIAFSETFGEFGPGNSGYYLASAFDRIYMQPSGDVGLTGLVFESMFIRGMLDKLGVVPRMDQRYEYKNAMNMYTETTYTEPHREAMQAILDSWISQIVRALADARGISEEQVQAIIDRGPYLGEEAREAGLVDELLYRDEVLARVREDAGARAELLFVGKYLERAGRPHSRGTSVALIHGYGGVQRGRSGYAPLSGDVIMGSDSVSAAFRAAVRDSSVKAILFRVDCPGGSYVASDTIRRELLRAQEAGKPVVVSMGFLAGSGGYFVAMDADRIVAQPATITASIGVLGGKMVTSAFWDKLGIGWDEVHVGENATQWSTGADYTETGNERFQASLDRIYEDFTGKVAQGRGIPIERVREIAKGRIWTGEQALELGLVDALGGFDVALAQIRELLELDEDASIRLKRFPRKRSPFSAWFGEQPDSSERVAAQTLREVVLAMQPTVRTLRRLELSSRTPEVLQLPDLPALDPNLAVRPSARTASP